MLLDFQEFLKRLEEVMNEGGGKGSYWLWFKQFPERVGKHRKGKDEEATRSLQIEQNAESKHFTLVVRLKTKKKRFSTRVPAKEAEYFQRLLHNVLLVNSPLKE
jgi:hypothetical protein